MKLTFLAATAVVAASANAQVMIGNYPFTNDDTQAALLNNLRVKAMGFTMGAVAYDLSSVTLRLSNVDTADLAFAQFRADAAGNPGAVLHTLITPAAMGAGTFDYSYSVNGSFEFQPGTVYWLTVGGAAGGSFDWEGSIPAVIPTGPGATHLGGRFTTNGGSTWTVSGIVNTYEVIADPVPEPASILGLGIGALMLLGLRRRK